MLILLWGSGVVGPPAPKIANASQPHAVRRDSVVSPTVRDVPSGALNRRAPVQVALSRDVDRLSEPRTITRRAKEGDEF